MPRDLHQLLHDTAVEPDHAPDVDQFVRRGDRRRRIRHGATALGSVAALVAVVAIGVGMVTLLDRPPRLDIADQPAETTSPPAHADGSSTAPADEPVITQTPALTVSSQEPFPWVVAASDGGEGRWCLSAMRGTTDMTGPSRLPCDHELRTSQDVGWVELGDADGDGQGLVGGIAPPDTRHVVVEFTDGTRRTARLETGDAVDMTLWAIGFEQGQVRAVEAQGDGWTHGGVALEDGWGVAEMLIVLGGLALVVTVLAATGWRIIRRRG